MSALTNAVASCAVLAGRAAEMVGSPRNNAVEIRMGSRSSRAGYENGWRTALFTHPISRRTVLAKQPSTLGQVAAEVSTAGDAR